MSSPLTEKSLRELPKIELHVHFEGSVALERIFADERDERLGDEGGQPPLQFEDLSDFLAFLDRVTGFFQTPEALSREAYNVARRAAASGIVYAEMIVSPNHWDGWELSPLVEAVSAGFERAAAAGLSDIYLLLSIDRRQSEREALELVEWMVKDRPARVVGLSVDGDESRLGRTSHRFAAAYRQAGKAGYGLTAHAGESSGPQGVRDALDILNVDRIDHGVRAVEDGSLVRRLVDESVPLNICVTSNRHLLDLGLDRHPIGRLYASGVPVTLNTDDPAVLGVTLVDEFARVVDGFSWGPADLRAVSHHAVDAAFCGSERKDRLRRIIDGWFEAKKRRFSNDTGGSEDGQDCTD